MWEHLKKIVNENKDNKLLNLDCFDPSITKYFQIISLTNLASKVLDENHVTYTINGLCDKFALPLEGVWGK